jgi:hypothetical protein
MTNTSGTLGERFRRATQELRALESELKAGQTPEPLELQDFRRVLDNTRLTAWTVSELLNARERQQDPEKVLSFVVAERLRRSTQLLKDLASDLEHEGVSWQTHGVQSLFEAVKLLQVQLLKLMDEYREEFRKTKEAAQ